MKYANFFRKTLVVALCGVVGACAFNSGHKNWIYDGSERVELVPTEQFLPLQERDEAGLLLPYEAAPNPYAELDGKIDKEIVARYIEARRAFNANKFDVADQLLAELSEEAPKLSGPLVMRGDIALDRGDLAEAVEYYVAAIDVTPVNFNSWLRLAKAQRMRGHFNHAQNTYARALELWPDGPELHLNLGVLYDVYLNQPLKAQAHMEAYQLLSGDRSGEVVAWLDEIRQRTGTSTALKTITGSSGSEKPESGEVADASGVHNLGAPGAREE
ncbi:tetratricopeptide repeat protein [Gilvimarinus sp. F26214L]|uniref:tetratricopeptide repeat protein n=1 Tax=Gilvimarinus sp. DZF01 TaxID=3461371 RepID=UPI004045D061